MNKKILLVTNYFPPEKGAAANRMFSLANGFIDKGYRVTVLCPLPNYPAGKVFDRYRGKAWKKDVIRGIVIRRLWIWPSNSGNKLIRLISMLSFSFSLAVYLIFRSYPKVVVVQYSPVFVGFTAVFWSRLFRKKIILNISDLWPKAGLEMGLLKKGFYYNILERMERFCVRSASLIMGQSDEIIDHAGKIRPEGRFVRYRNYPDFDPPELPEEAGDEKIHLVYAGLLGVAQGLYNICTNIDFPEHIHLHIYGAGPEATRLAAMETSQIHFHGELSRDMLHRTIITYDMAFVPLVNRIYGSVPSKIFEFSRLGLPILYFAGGEGSKVVSSHKIGKVVPAGDLSSLQQALDDLSREDLQSMPKATIRRRALKAFDFQQQFEEVEGVIAEL